MTQSSIIRTLAVTLAALLISGAALAGTTGTSSTDVTVSAVNAMTLTAGGTLSLAPSVGADASDSTTTLDFETNDGQTFKITASADGWTFAPSVDATLANTYPVLTIAASTTAGSPSTAQTLLDASNVATTRDIVTGIVSTTGTATVTLSASVTQTVVAGAYSTTITYSFVSP